MERLVQDLDYDRNRFLFLYGKGVQDCFLSNDYREIYILEAMYDVLRKKNFDIILFYSHTQRIFFFDAESRAYCRPSRKNGNTAKLVQRNTENVHEFKGPMGKRQLLQAPTNIQSSNEKPADNSDTRVSFSQIDDSRALQLIDHLMRDTTHRTAVVIDQAETSLHYFADHADQAGRMGGWANLPISNRNLCILLFASQDLPQKNKDQSEFIPIPEITTFFEDSLKNKHSRCVLKVPPPDKAETLRMLDYNRIINKIAINWKERERAAEMIANDGAFARDWLLKLSRLNKLEIASLVPLLRSDPGSPLPWRERLTHLEGLELIKKRVNQLEAYLQDRREREKLGRISLHEQPPALHLAFLGNPGTGKTKVAELIGEMYRDLGLLKKGHTVKVEYKDLISEHVGGTVAQTDEQVDKALDGVLFIDEAYQLAEDDRGGFGQEAIDRLLTRMENERARLVVIVAGYTGKMQKLFRSNPGLLGRIPVDNQITFPDYTPAELMKILHGFIEGKGLAGSEAFNRSILEVVENLYHERDEETFSNARKMRELADSVEVMRATRRVGLGLPADSLMEPEDISPEYQRYLLPTAPKIENLLAEINSLVGLEKVKEMVTDLVYRLRANKRRMELGQKIEKQQLNMFFIGNPGTGKTTVALMLGKIFQAVGLLRRGHVHPIRAGDLIAGYLGQTDSKAREAMKEALDGVLFIDEAYELTPGGASDTFKTEAMGSLMRYIDQYPDRLVVIMAGYPKEMADLIGGSNLGLPRRFTQTLIFADYSDDDLLEILRRKAEKMGVHLSQGVLSRARIYFQNERKISGDRFGNAGVVDKLIGIMIGSQARRLNETDDDRTLNTFEPEDVPGIQNSDAPINNQQYLHYDLANHLHEFDNNGIMTVDLAKAAVGLLQVKNKTGDGTGTGFVVTPQGHLLTAYHVVQGAKQVTFRLDGTEKELDAEVVGLDEQADLAVLRLPLGSDYPWVPLSEAGYTPAIGQDIGVLGYPLGQQFGEEITFTDGVVSSLRSESWMIQISAPVTHGSSGGPVFRKSDLRVIGAVHGGSKETGAQINFASNIQLVYLRFGTNPVKMD